MRTYIPEQGDIVSLSFDPQSGHEQKGRRPAMVVSKTLFNKATGMAIFCPLTNTDRRMPFHVSVAGRTPLTGFVMCEQIKSLDFRARRAAFIHKAPRSLLDDVLGIVEASIF